MIVTPDEVMGTTWRTTVVTAMLFDTSGAFPEKPLVRVWVELEE